MPKLELEDLQLRVSLGIVSTVSFAQLLDFKHGPHKHEGVGHLDHASAIV